MPNALTRHVGLNAGTWVVETLVKHYFEHAFGDRKAPRTNGTDSVSGNLRQDELLYDEVFNIVKSFLDASTHHTVEELQRFSNTRTPSAPWMHVVRVLVPMSCCETAATHLIEALGGEEKTKQVVGGTKWWQVRGLQGVDAQWIVAKKDYHKAKKRRKEWEKERVRRETLENEEATYMPEMDEMRCILYFHGGGYYFGSVDQERYFIQRFARKSGCRLLAINYRLAPQYPFPCPIQDALAAYLYLIKPPPDALHTPVRPEHIIVSGDSAGGGLTIALLQVLRDSGLPLPAGAIPISPWCDLTHSFPSIHLNTDTDVIPKYGLSMHKPSILWPPPPDELTERVHEGLRKRIKQVARRFSDGGGEDSDGQDLPRRKSFFKRKFDTVLSLRKRSKSRGRSSSRSRPPIPNLADDAQTGDVRSAAVSRSHSKVEDESGEVAGDNGVMKSKSNAGRTVDLGSMAELPSPESNEGQTITLVAENGDKLVVKDQVQLYAPNNLLNHPLISPALSYLGGLPPLLIIASDGEVLRDEIIYSAHKAAHPARYPVKAEARKLYPKLEGIEERYGPTKVHLQVYDQTAHVLPVLFSFCTPAKFCFRALATFTKYVTGTLENPTSPREPGSPGHPSSPKLSATPSFRRALSLSLPRRSSLMLRRQHRGPSQSIQDMPPKANGIDSPAQLSSTSGSRISVDGIVDSSPPSPTPGTESVTNQSRCAGDPNVYVEVKGDPPSPFMDNMIRERVSTRGEIRPLEPEVELAACTLPHERVGVVDELAIRRYIEGKTRWDERYKRTTETIRKQRAKNLNIAKSETVRNVQQLQMHFIQNGQEQEKGGKGHMHVHDTVPNLADGLRKTAASWTWAWAADDDERPPSSSIVARRDTEEARRLSKIADQPITEDEHRLSGNNLWMFLFNSLSTEKAVPGTPRSNASGSDHSDSQRRRRAESVAVQDSTTTERQGKVKRFLSASAPVPKRTASSPPIVHIEQT